ncbi:MAG: glycosyltransferase [Salinigranum sp.]
MNVLQLVPKRRPFFDGQVRALERRGVECTVVTVPGTYSPTSPRSVREYLRFYGRTLRAAIGRHDVVHANYGLLGPLALAQPRRPVVLTLWGSDLMGEADWLTRLSRASARLADATVLPSRAMASELPGSYTYIPFGVDTDLFRPIQRSAARERVGWDREGAVALFPYDPARPEKDYRLAKRVVERAPIDVRLEVVSSAPHEEMPHYLNASDALLVTSTRESGPMVAKEAAACGVPVVSTDVGFVSEIPGATVCETADGLATALAGAVGDDRSVPDRPPVDEGEYGLDRMAERLVSLYAEATDGRATA